jgi:hypothetical protein
MRTGCSPTGAGSASSDAFMWRVPANVGHRCRTAHGAAPDGEQSSIAALELLAAQTVADRTYAAPPRRRTMARLHRTPAPVPPGRSCRHRGRAIEPSERDVLGVAAALVPPPGAYD